MKDTHEIVLHQSALAPEEGLLLGNGDLSVSVYQALDQIRFRFGKGDVWDRRLDFRDDPRPAHIDEIARGIREEGWRCGSYGGPAEAIKGTDNPERMKEICQGCPPSYERHPFPCPKPVCELTLHYPGDLLGLEINQRLTIELGLMELTLSWRGGVELVVAGAIHPDRNRMSLSWELRNWQGSAQYGGHFEGLPEALPIWFSLHRWPDPAIGEFARRHARETRHPGFLGYIPKDDPPLPPPRVFIPGGPPALVQDFPGDTLFENGFAFAAVADGPGLRLTPLPESADGATIHGLPSPKVLGGELSISVVSTGDLSARDRGKSLGVAEVAEARNLAADSKFDEDRLAAAEAGLAFWSRSAVCLQDPFLENLWYATLHAKRCVLRRGKTPPGLFLPSTVRDYGLWHGDYHTNYNFQSIFLGDFAANHSDLGDAYFEGIGYFIGIGRKIARDYYGCRGAFVQLSGYPTHPVEDPIGTAPMGRMAYMTGWAAAHFHARWRYTQDREWLTHSGYPAVRDFALFYTDFLRQEEDGLYHAFPSNQGEDGFSGDAKPYTDRAQVLRHARYCLTIALEMAVTLGADDDLQIAWRECLDRLAPEDGDADRERFVLADKKYWRLAPEFLGFDGAIPPRDASVPPAFLRMGHDFHDWYPGKIPYEWTTHLRNEAWRPERDLPLVKALLERWVHPNGLLWAMALINYGRVGGWTESLGIIGPLQDMLLQSWSGIIEVFPGWPRSQNASFTNLRAEGGFLISATLKGGEVSEIRVCNEQGNNIVLNSPWPGRSIIVTRSEDSDGLSWSFEASRGPVEMPGMKGVFVLKPEA